MRASSDTSELLESIVTRLSNLEHQAEYIKVVLMVKEPDSVHAADAYLGLRKQIMAAMNERRAHLTQLTMMAVAVERANDIGDLRAQVEEWLQQAGIVRVRKPEEGRPVHEIFEDAGGGSLEGAEAISVLEPAYVDSNTDNLIRLGRAVAVAVAPDPAPPASRTRTRSRADLPAGDIEETS